jgi:tight adherence protein B
VNPADRRRRHLARIVTLLTAAVLMLMGSVSAAYAAEGSIDHVQNRNGKLQILYSLPGASTAPDLSSLSVTLGGTQADAEATLASQAQNAVRRTAVLAIDVSESMRANGKFVEAKRAAQIFIDSAPADLHIGIVTFAGTVTVAQEPTLDRSASKAVVDGLTLSRGTFLYDGLTQAVATSGRRGQRSVIVLSDGRDTSATSLESVASRIKKEDVKVDVVALAQSARDEQLLQPLSDAGKGSMISAADPRGLSTVFADEARSLANQLQITATPPKTLTSDEATLAVSVDADGATYSDAAFVTIVRPQREAAKRTVLAPAKSSFQFGPNVMLGGLVGIGIGVAVLLAVALGGVTKEKESLEDRIAAYTGKSQPKRSTPPAPQGVAAQAVGVAAKALESQHGLEEKLNAKLEAGGLTLRPPEWLLIHAGIVIGAGTLTLLLTTNVLFTALGVVAGAFLPWFYLGMRQSRRLKAFNSQLSGTLQLMAGSLQAGLSLTQGMDTIVREGAEPVAGEFRRALVEARLGIPIEDALEGLAERMDSDDFKWTVMAIRIQREVGGNLSELLLNVAGTLREREYLRRQVKSLSAEGRFSAYILLALPPLILLYEFVTNGAYVAPLVSTPIGFMMLGAMAGMMAIGGFMMKKMIKLEV